GGIVNIAALRRERPSEVVVLFKLTRIAVVSVMAGMVVALAFGLWLVADLDFVKWTNAWVISAIVLWFVANALGSNGGRRDRRARGRRPRLAGGGGGPGPGRPAPGGGPGPAPPRWGRRRGPRATLVLTSVAR